MLFILLAGAALFLLGTGPGERIVAQLVNRIGSTENRRIAVEDISGLLGGDSRIGRLVISDGEGEPWLVLEGVAIDWSPGALLSSGLDIDRLSADRVDILDLPEGGATAEGGSGPLGLPLDIDVDRLELPDIRLAEAVAGREARLAAEGSLKLDRALADVRADLDVRRTDGVGGSASLDLIADVASQKFDLAAEIVEPAGGVLAHLAGLAPSDSVAIKAKSAGTLADWTLDMTGEIDGRKAAGAELSVRRGEAGHRFDLDASGAIGRFLPPSLAGLFSGESAVFATGLVEADRTGLQVDAMTLDSASLHLEGSGRLAREGAVDFQATVTASGEAVDLGFGSGEGRVELAVREARIEVSGTAADATATVTADVAAATLPDMRIDEATVRLVLSAADLSAGTGEGTVHVEAASVGAANPMLARALAGAVVFDGPFTLDEDTVATDGLSLRSAAARLDLSGRYGRADGAASGRLSGEINSAILSAGLPERVGRTLAVETRFAVSGEGAVALDDVAIAGENLAAGGSFSLDGDRQITASLAADIADTARLAPKSTGALHVEADLSGPLSAPQIAASITGRDLAVAGEPIEDLRVTAEGVADPEAPRADIEVSGTFRDQPISGTARLAARDGRNVVDPLRLTVEGNRIEGSLVLDDAFRPTGTVELDLPDLSALSALALADYAGSAKGRLAFSVEGDTPVLAADLSAQGLTGSAFALEDARIDARISDYLDAPAVTGTADVARLDIGKTGVENLSVDFSQAQGWTRFEATARAEGLPVDAAGRFRQAEGEAVLELASARIVYRGLPVRLVSPARIAFGNGTARIADLVLSPGGGRVSVAGTAGEKLDLAVRLDDVPLSVVEALAPGTGLKGNVSGTVAVSGTPAVPVAKFDLSGSGVGAAALAAVSAPPLAVTASGQYTGDAVDFSASGSASGGLRLRAEGRVGIGGGDKSLAIEADGSAPFSFIAAPLAARGLVLDGAATVDLSIGGTVASPSFSGSVTTAGARFLDTRSGISVDDLSADIALDRQSVRIRSLTGNLAGGGKLTGSGTVGLDGGAGYPADLALEVDNGRYADGRMVATDFSADLTLKGPLVNEPTLGGVVRLDETAIIVPDGLPNTIASLDVTHENAGAAVRAQEERLEARGGNGAGGGLALDLRIEAPNRIFVRGRGIDAEFGGSLTLRGTTGSPVASGSFDLVRGRLTVLTRSLVFDRGRIGFSGSLVPVLDFAASTRAGDTTATVIVSGPANDPEFAFTSSPDLPQDEVLALLVFGRSLSDLSPLQIAQLADAAAQLTGVSSGGGIVEQLRRATGIDDLDIRTDEETGDTSVAVGKYLNDRTYLGLEQGATAGSGKARIDLDLGRGLKLRGEAGSGGEAKGGIFFEKDY